MRECEPAFLPSQCSFDPKQKGDSFGAALLEDLSTYRSSLGQTHHAFADDVVLNLAGAAGDGKRARCEHPVRPLALVERERRLEIHLAVRPQQLHREFVHPQIQLAYRKLEDGTLRPRRQTLEASRDLAEAGVLDRGRFTRELRYPLPHVV